ncbi:type I polyketide synthase [Plantactinospora soyae]|uniref:Acyl transferase domain-containing protein n=1 Tax=Plantactinospora soyae TaxID=1544732 RepID=A0A927R3J2_9ACTN|nr:type I polyketide synthase [Plantactinospora soyae]MBE1485549.1 acyl transferase domain-containing protein [Plantactinospora soyae]
MEEKRTVHIEPVEEDHDDLDGRVAIVGMAGRFPGADTVDELWDLLADGTEAVSRFTREELRATGVPDSLADAEGYVAAKGVLSDVAGFDAQLFGYSPLEAAVIDPQQRIFLECAWSALENAGYDSDRTPGAVGVYAGAMLSSYLIHNLLPRTDLQAKLGVPMMYQANQPDQLAARVAYQLNLRGPAITVQTACSTSLVAVHLAAQSLLTHECDLALAGGVAVTVPERAGYLPTPGGIESPDGHCKPYGAGAAGTVFGNGAGVVVLKRLTDAVADRDHIYAVVIGSAVNNDAAARAGFTAPGVAGQTAVIREALSVAGVRPETIGYVEGHGTGTAIGDQIEVAALAEAYRPASGGDPDRGAAPWCALGSVKSNLGHLDTAAGVTGLIKAVLTVGHGSIPASLHAEPANPVLGLDATPFFVPARMTEWPVSGEPRRAAVSAFGIGGTNAHVIVEQAPRQPAADVEVPPPSVSSLPVALPLSARTPAALDTLGGRIAARLAEEPGLPLDDVARTLRSGRRELPHRRVVLAADRATGLAALRAPSKDDSVAARALDGNPPVVFLLPGQGTLTAGTGLALYEAHPVFREALDECTSLLREHLDRPLPDLLRSAEECARTSVAQPAVVALSYATARLLGHWGVRPAALLGHSLGEYSAALLSGVFGLADALALVATRGRLMERMATGGMLAVGLGEEAAREVAAVHGLSVAAVNGAAATVLAGALDDLDRAAGHLAERGLRPLRLPVDRAFHSPSCEPVAAELTRLFAGIPRSAPNIPMLSNVTGDWLTAQQATSPEYWARHLCEPVRFADGLRTAAELDDRMVLVESGPGSVLTDLVRAVGGQDRDRVRLAPPPLPSRHRQPEPDEARSSVRCLAGLWTHGVSVRWEPVAAGARLTPLPEYPFEHVRHWIEPSGEAVAGPIAGPADTAEDPDEPVYARLVWQPEAARPERSPDVVGTRRHTWLVFMDSAERAQPVVDRLTSLGQVVTSVRAGQEYRRVRRGVYEIDPADPAQYSKLLADLRGLVRTPTAIVYAWGLPGADPAPDPSDAYFGLIRLVRAMTAETVVNDVRLGVLTGGAFAATPADRPDPAAALLSGPVMVLGEEYRNLHPVQVDLPVGRAIDADAVDAVLRVTLSAEVPLVALRNGEMLTRVVQQTRSVGDRSALARLPRGGTVLITGGLGGIGRTLAHHLARTAGARIALLQRRPAPGPADTDPAAVALRTLRETGAEVITVQADITDPTAVWRALDEVRARFGRIDGVVHAAGLPGGGSIELRTDAEMASVLAPKTSGLNHLLDALRPDEAGVVVLCSSLATVIPTYGQADYAAANAYLAAVAEAAAVDPGNERQVFAIDWDMWSQVGMASTAEVPADLRNLQRHLLDGALTQRQAERALQVTLAGPVGRMLVVRTGARVEDGRLRLTEQPLVAAPPTVALPRPDLDNPYVAPRTDTEARVAEVYAEMFGLERVGVEDGFLEIGGHSLLAAQIAARLRSEFRVDVPARVFFDGGRVADVAAEIEEQIIAELERHD